MIRRLNKFSKTSYSVSVDGGIYATHALNGIPVDFYVYQNVHNDRYYHEENTSKWIKGKPHLWYEMINAYDKDAELFVTLVEETRKKHLE